MNEKNKIIIYKNNDQRKRIIHDQNSTEKEIDHNDKDLLNETTTNDKKDYKTEAKNYEQTSPHNLTQDLNKPKLSFNNINTTFIEVPQKPVPDLKFNLFKRINLNINEINKDIITSDFKSPEVLVFTKQLENLEIKNLNTNIVFQKYEHIPQVLIPLIKNPPILMELDINSVILIEKDITNTTTIEDDFMEIEEDGIKRKELNIDLVKSSILSAEPLILFLVEPKNKNLVYVFEQLIKRIYREKEGKIPESLIIGISENNNEEFINKMDWLKAEHRIITLKFETFKSFESIMKNYEIKKRLINKINQLFSQKYGVIIFNITDNSEINKEVMLRIEEIRSTTRQTVEIIPFFYENFASSISNNEEFIFNISGVSVPNFPKTIGKNNIGQIFEYLLKTKKKILHNLKREKGGLYYILTKPHNGPESEEHRLYKTLIVKYLVKKLTKSNNQNPSYKQLSSLIKSEEPLENVVPDIYYINERTAFEIETLFGEDSEGRDVIDKIKQTIEKYRGNNMVDKICIVLDSMSFYLHKKEIINLLKLIKEEIEKEIYIWIPHIRLTKNKYKIYFKKIRV